MKLWYEPKVYCIAQTEVNHGEMIRFVGDHGFDPDGMVADMFESLDTDLLPEFSGRMCYMSFDKGRPSKEYIEHILQVGHGSVLEHTNITLAFVGISRTLTHELVRHRAGFAYSQLSQRFVNEESVGFVVPPFMIGKDECIEKFVASNEAAMVIYKDFIDTFMKELSTVDRMMGLAERAGLMEESNDGDEQFFHLCGHYNTREELKKIFETNYLGAKKDLKKATYTARKKTALEASRSVLPNCTETKITVTANGRAWRHFLGMRGTIHADLEIRRLACIVAGVLKERSPLLFQDVDVQTDPGDGLPYVKMEYHKV